MHFWKGEKNEREIKRYGLYVSLSERERERERDAIHVKRVTAKVSVLGFFDNIFSDIFVTVDQKNPLDIRSLSFPPKKKTKQRKRERGGWGREKERVRNENYKRRE